MATVTLGGNAVKVEGNFPQVGATAPAFTLVKNDLSEFSLQDVKGKKVVLNIFPSLDTAVCATSVRKFNQTDRWQACLPVQWSCWMKLAKWFIANSYRKSPPNRIMTKP